MNYHMIFVILLLKTFLTTNLDTLGTRSPYDPMEPERGYFWNDNQAEISRYWLVYVSRWLRVDQFLDDSQSGITYT